MKKVILVWSLAVLGMGVASAESNTTDKGRGKFFPDRTQGFQQGNPGTPQERAEQLTASMTTDLVLSAEQTAKVKEINVKRFTEQQEMRQKAQAGGDREAMREQMQTIRKKYDDQMKAVLTEEQFTKYAASPGQMRGQRGGERAPEKAPEKAGKRSRNI